MKSKSILELGQIVHIGNKGKRNIEAEIVAVCIRKDTVKYEVAWWKDDNKKTEWIFEYDMTINKAKRKKLGFTPQ